MEQKLYDQLAMASGGDEEGPSSPKRFNLYCCTMACPGYVFSEVASREVFRANSELDYKWAVSWSEDVIRV